MIGYYSASQIWWHPFWPEILWKWSVAPYCVETPSWRPLNAYETPTKPLRKASSLRGNAPSMRRNAYETPTQWGCLVHIQRIPGQNRCHHIWDQGYKSIYWLAIYWSIYWYWQYQYQYGFLSRSNININININMKNFRAIYWQYIASFKK